MFDHRRQSTRRPSSGSFRSTRRARPGAEPLNEIAPSHRVPQVVGIPALGPFGRARVMVAGSSPNLARRRVLAATVRAGRRACLWILAAPGLRQAEEVAMIFLEFSGVPAISTWNCGINVAVRHTKALVLGQALGLWLPRTQPSGT